MENTTMPETTSSTIDDPRVRLASAVEECTRLLRGIAPDQYDLATPCPPMTVAAVAEHLVMALRRVADAGRDVPPAQWPLDAADVAAGAWADALQQAGTDAQQAWADPSLLTRPTVLPWGTFPGRDVLDVYTNEMVVHTCDLAAATGLAADWDPAVLEASLAVMTAQLPTADRAPIWEAVFAGIPEGVEVDVPFANAIAVAEDAPLIDRLLAWNGRTP